MLAQLKDHPFSVEAYFDYSIVLTFAYPKEQLAHLLPECLELETYQDKWAFLAVAIVQTKGLRPKGFPSFLGNDFLLTGYRLFVKYTDIRGKRLRGLYILKSETDKKLMETLGSIFTRYKYSTTDIVQQYSGSELLFNSDRSGFNIQLNRKNNDINLPVSSPFADWKEARRFAGPLPFTFSYNAKSKMVLIVEGVRENWMPQPIQVISYSIPYLSINGLDSGALANAFIIDNIQYSWKKGRTEIWR